ncbi:hypothetical protein V6N12_045870 [Hibiscus sabdariffa]|uniref:Uncharacterized protein n=1 Tax=Hibiscus sabdariffa TaxID=183260 RepID=A0ABR2G410_9ROSI
MLWSSIVITMEPLCKQMNPDLIKDPNTFLGASTSYKRSLDREDVEICKVHTDDNIADPLTKPLSQQKHDRHTESPGIRYVSDWS